MGALSASWLQLLAEIPLKFSRDEYLGVATYQYFSWLHYCFINN
jgi:hypothetical protein